MTANVFRPVPDRLYAAASPAAGQVLAANRRRPREEFHPNWDHICSAAATADEVVAALCQSADDVPDRMRVKVLQTHAPDAWALLVEHEWSWEEFNSGHVPADSAVPNQIVRLVNTALGGYQVLAGFAVADLAWAAERTLGQLPEFR